MNELISISRDSLPDIDRREVMRYAGGGNLSGELATLFDECISEATEEISCRICYQSFDIKKEENRLDLTFCSVESEALAKNLRECDSVILFGATIGIGIDRLIMKYGKLSPLKGLIMQAIGTERIEALCDTFEDRLRENGYILCPRFSPGYGDLPIEMQKDIFSALELEKRIGLTLTSSYLMSPTKSVTAIIGIKGYENA